MAGYKVLEAADGQAALEIASLHAGGIDLLVTDVVMPKMGGAERRKPRTSATRRCAVLYLSQDTADAMVHHGVSNAKAAFLQKPFTPQELTRKIRELLDGRESLPDVALLTTPR